MSVVNIQRSEQGMAVRYDAQDESDHGVIRGWLGIPFGVPLTDTTLVDGSWIVRDPAGGQLYQVDHETFTESFIIVLDVTEESGE